MGTDIHSKFQRQTNDGEWEDIETKYNEDRHYQLFAVLAGVRNGVGFAGVRTGEPVVPISDPRGLPDGVGNYDWEFGDHNHSWLTGDEMLKWYENSPTVTKMGIVDKKTYLAWDHVSTPYSYCGGVDGFNVLVAEDIERKPDGWSHVRIVWRRSLREELAYFFDEVKRLVDEYGTIRFVFGFDS